MNDIFELNKNKHFRKKYSLPGRNLLLERDLLPFTNHFLFFDIYFKEKDYFNMDKEKLKLYLFNNLQVIFNKILKKFFQTRLDLDENYRRSITGQMMNYLLFRNILVNGKYEKEIGKLTKSNNIIDLKTLKNMGKRDYLELVSRLYRDIDFLKDSIYVKRDKHELNIKEFNPEDTLFDRKSYSTITFLQKQIKKNLNQQLDLFLVHGSYATGDFITDWSDLDTFVILNKHIFSDFRQLEYTQNELQKLSLLCFKINPLAHHAFFVYPDLVLENYSNQPLPIPVLEKSVALFKKGDLVINYSNNQLIDFYTIYNYLIRFRKKVFENRYSRNIFAYQNDIADVLILPALMFQAQKEPIYKKLSFDKVKKRFPDLDLSLIDLASQKRKNWKFFNLLKFYPNICFNLLPNRLNNFLINKYRFWLMKFGRVNHLEVENFTRRALDLCEKIFIKCCSQNYKNNGTN